MHPIVDALLSWRELDKLNSTYLEALPKQVDPRDGRVHTTFNQTGAATGRLSSTNPNLQNIPIRGELGRQIRRAFVPGSMGEVLLVADYSQIELRILAHLSGDEGLRSAFESGADIHTATSAKVFGLPEDRIRFHLCWGSWHGPHTTDVPMREIVEVMLAVKCQAYSFEAANVRHEHEWKVWRDVKLPDGKLILPGIVSHATNVVEHPELVAERIERFASVVGRERVIASTDCGLGGRVHGQIAWAKLEALADGAALASRALWR